MLAPAEQQPQQHECTSAPTRTFSNQSVLVVLSFSGCLFLFWGGTLGSGGAEQEWIKVFRL